MANQLLRGSKHHGQDLRPHGIRNEVASARLGKIQPADIPVMLHALRSEAKSEIEDPVVVGKKSAAFDHLHCHEDDLLGIPFEAETELDGGVVPQAPVDELDREILFQVELVVIDALGIWEKG